MKTRLILAITRATAPLTVRLARSGRIPLWAVVRHCGSRRKRLHRFPDRAPLSWLQCVRNFTISWGSIC